MRSGAPALALQRTPRARPVERDSLAHAQTEDECVPPCTTETGLKDCQIWTETCKPFCQNPHGGDGPEGCYELETHKCECGTTEEECKAKPGYNSEWFWTPGCGTCATGSSAFVIQGYSM